MSSCDEQALAERARHDAQAFAALYDRFVERVFLFALRRTGDGALAEDITSATFEKALRHLRQHGWKGSSYLAWLYRLAYHQIVEHYRRNHRFVALLPDQAADTDVERQAQSSLRWQAVARAFRSLARTDQEVLALRLFDRLSSAEVAEVLGCSPRVVYVRLYRALQRLRGQLEALGEFNGEGKHGPR
jgi:RNA polymerase sigma-70 factor (ECF subfamily)